MQSSSFTPQQTEQFIRAYDSRRRRRAVIRNIITLGIVIGLPAMLLEVDTVFGLKLIYMRVVGAALFLGGMAFMLIDWRCPNCSKFLTSMDKEYCMECGARFTRK